MGGGGPGKQTKLCMETVSGITQCKMLAWKWWQISQTRLLHKIFSRDNIEAIWHRILPFMQIMPAILKYPYPLFFKDNFILPGHLQFCRQWEPYT